MSNRHAYLIACHNNYYILRKLLLTLDDERNDIYIHVDKRWKEFNKRELVDSIKKANIVFVKRRRVNWGGYSQIKTTMQLLSEAVKTEHSYYHFISGVDMPLKTQDDIHEFFKRNYPKEFVGFDRDSNVNEANFRRIKYYYPFQELIGRSDSGVYKYIRIMQNLLLVAQEKLKVNRLGALEGKIYKGPNWFSITHELAKYIVANKKRIRKHFSKSVCADEVVVQTLVMNSKFKENITDLKIRHIDWQRGTPYTFRAEDYQELIRAECLFARKFDEKIDIKIVDAIYDFVIR